MVTIWKSIFDKEVHYLDVDKALARIKNGKSREAVEKLRATLDKAKSDSIKRLLPAVAFAGEFVKRGDKALKSHSGFLVLDFDKLNDISETAAILQAFPNTYAAWVSPSGNGMKALIKIADGTKHREHFAALKEVFPDADPSGVNEERLCFESYDEHIYINKKAIPYTTIQTVRQQSEKVFEGENDEAKFRNLLKWIANKEGAFSSGSRNNFVFKLAGSCCRFGIHKEVAGILIRNEFACSNDFTLTEMMTAVKSAYRKNQDSFGSVQFDRERIVDIKSRKEVAISDLPSFDPNEPSRDVIYASDVKAQALEIYHHGYAQVKGINIPEIDERWKPKRGEISLLSGIGNYGKSALWKWYKLLRVMIYGERFASFCPEDNPPAEYYHDFVEILLGCQCTDKNPNRPPQEIYERAYDWVGEHIFYIYPQDASPTPEYIMQTFLELIVKEKIDGVSIDPFNQLIQDYGPRTDKYLEKLLNTFSRFAQENNIYFMIIAHPKLMVKNQTGNYPCPDVYDIADGAMWNNKLDNILIYHRPVAQTEPNASICELHSKKIRRQKSVGKRGVTEMRYMPFTRRFEVGDIDPIAQAMKHLNIDFGIKAPMPIPQHVTQDFSPLILPDGFWD